MRLFRSVVGSRAVVLAALAAIVVQTRVRTSVRHPNLVELLF